MQFQNQTCIIKKSTSKYLFHSKKKKINNVLKHIVVKMIIFFLFIRRLTTVNSLLNISKNIIVFKLAENFTDGGTVNVSTVHAPRQFT